MKKSNYQSPKTEIVEIHTAQLICTSVVGPGEDNAPAGSRGSSFDDEN